MKIDVLLVRHPANRPSPVMPAMIEHLEAAGATVRRVYPDEGATVPAPGEVDLVVLKSKTPAALELARQYHEAGIASFNTYPVTVLCRDKIATTRALEQGGVPVPTTWAVQDATELATHLADGPLIVKPYRGSQGRGIEVVRTPEELGGIDHGGDVILAQRYMEPDGKDRKIYRIGDEVFCVERVWPPTNYEEKLGRLVEIPPAVEAAARASGDALGIDTYGVDIIEHHGEPYVVDLSSFPGFKGVPDAGARLARRILTLLGR
nr:ATP-grasp domain-containing protein [Actinomycetales bacterium]